MIPQKAWILTLGGDIPDLKVDHIELDLRISEIEVICEEAEGILKEYLSKSNSWVKTHTSNLI